MNNISHNSIETSEPIVLKEKLSRQLLRSVMAQFSSLTEAILELVDNIFDEFDGITGGHRLDIDIVITKRSITVENLGGRGMGLEELRHWLSWGEVHKTDAIGEYGQGGKAAMGYLGHSWIVKCKRWDEQRLWELKEDYWDDMSGDVKTYHPIFRETDEWYGLGYCRFEMRNLKRRRQEIGRIRTELSNIYRNYLDEGKATIRVNSEPLRPMTLPLYEGYKIQHFKRGTPSGFHVKGWIGRLKRDTRIKSESKIIGGMRLLRKGRLICDEQYFGHHDFRYKASLGNLIGEAELSKVPVLPNKTGFDTDSPSWVEVRDVMYDILKPHIDNLLSQKGEETITREDKKRVAQVRELMIEAFKILSKYSDFTSSYSEERGRKSPERKPVEQETVRLPEKPETEAITEREKQPRTSPPIDAIGRLMRLGRMPDWDLRSLEPHIRSVWDEKDGRRCLVINNDFCLFKERDGDPIYIAETAALELAKPQPDDKITLDQCLFTANQIIRAFCDVLNTKDS